MLCNCESKQWLPSLSVGTGHQRHAALIAALGVDSSTDRETPGLRVIEVLSQTGLNTERAPGPWTQPGTGQQLGHCYSTMALSLDPCHLWGTQEVSYSM